MAEGVAFFNSAIERLSALHDKVGDLVAARLVEREDLQAQIESERAREEARRKDAAAAAAAEAAGGATTRPPTAAAAASFCCWATHAAADGTCDGATTSATFGLELRDLP